VQSATAQHLHNGWCQDEEIAAHVVSCTTVVVASGVYYERLQRQYRTVHAQNLAAQSDLLLAQTSWYQLNLLRQQTRTQCVAAETLHMHVANQVLADMGPESGSAQSI
jgi:hypothetical protein